MSTVKTTERSLHRLPALDGFRGLGCLLVMLGHTQWVDKKTILPGALTAMDLFFVLSGFLITGLLLNEFQKTQTIQFFTFIKRRAIRLLPVFYVYFSIGALVYFFSKFQMIVGTDAAVTLWSTAFYASNWAMAYGYQMGIFAVTWSLSLEEQFYLLWPLLFLFLFHRLNKVKVAWVLFFGIIAVNVHRYLLFHKLLESDGALAAVRRCFHGLDTRSDSLMIGCLACILYQLYGQKFKIKTSWAFAAIVIFLGSTLIRDVPVAFHIDQNSFYTEFLMSGGFTIMSSLGALIILHLVQSANSPIAKFFSSEILVRVGLMSYSIYIWHTTVFGGLELALSSFNSSPYLWLIKTVIRFAVALGIGYLSFRFIELPILKRQFQKRKYSPVTA